MPAWKTDFQPRLASYDGSITAVYESFLKAVPKKFANESAQAFVKFKTSKTESFKNKDILKSYVWNERAKDALKQFVDKMVALPQDDKYSFKFTIDKNTKTE